jgi:diguanylate cyclase (GGDEF)-like protein/PAS domain S-box-containing protein
MEQLDPSAVGDEQRFRLLVEAVQDYALYTLDPSGIVLTWDTGTARHKGYASNEIIGKHFGCFFLPEDVAAGIPEQELAITAVSGRFEGEGWRLRQDGSRFWAEVNLAAIRREDGTLLGFAKAARDLTAKKQREDALSATIAELHEEMDSLQSILYSMPAAVISTDTEARIIFMNALAESMTGWNVREARGLPIEKVFELMDAETDLPGDNPVHECLADRRATRLKDGLVLVSRNDERQTIQNSAAPIRGHGGEIIGAILVFQTIVHVSQIQRELRFKVSHDPLTSLANREQLEIRLHEAIRNAEKDDTEHTLCFLNLDHFNIIVESAGYAAGDALLQGLAETIRECVRATDFVARLGGDEFAFILFHCNSEQAPDILIPMLGAIAAIRFPWDGVTHQVTASVGTTEITSAATSVNQMMKQADLACHTAKRAGRNRISSYERDKIDGEEHHSRLRMVTVIRGALAQNRFRLYAQKIVPIGKNSKPHYELLVRMLNHNGDLVPPSQFIPAAERYDLMGSIDRWVLREALGRLGPDIDAIPDLVVNINVSAQSLNDPKFLPFFLDLIENSKLKPSRLTIEITETALIGNLATAGRIVEKLRSTGCKIALDDFGAGLSSFGYLRNFKVDFIKIDGSFVKNMLRSPVDLVIVKSINQIAHELQAQTVGEFVENDATFEILKELKIDFAQGYAMGRPEPIEAALRQAQNYPRDPSDDTSDESPSRK